MEFIALLLIIVPAFVLGTIVSFFLLRKIVLALRIMFSIILGIAIGYISPCFVAAFFNSRIRNQFIYWSTFVIIIASIIYNVLKNKTRVINIMSSKAAMIVAAILILIFFLLFSPVSH